MLFAQFDFAECDTVPGAVHYRLSFRVHAAHSSSRSSQFAHVDHVCSLYNGPVFDSQLHQQQSAAGSRQQAAASKFLQMCSDGDGDGDMLASTPDEGRACWLTAGLGSCWACVSMWSYSRCGGFAGASASVPSENYYAVHIVRTGDDVVVDGVRAQFEVSLLSCRSGGTNCNFALAEWRRR